MDLDPLQLFGLLQSHSEAKDGPKICYQHLSNLSDFLTQENVYLRDLDLFLQHFFKSQGFSDFFSKVSNKKEFKSSVIKIFEIIYTLINNFPAKLEKYVEDVSNICFKVIKSSLVTSDEKVKSLEVLILTLEKIDISAEKPQYYSDIYNILVNSISIKKSDSVEEKLFIALGTFAKHFELLVPDHEHLRNIFLKALEPQMLHKDFSNRVVCGAFTGLEYYCESFGFDYELKEHQIILGKLVRYIEKVAVPKGTVKIGNRAAIRFLANNMSQFVQLMIDKVKYWHETLLNWLKLGSDDQKVGVLAVEALYRAWGEFLLNDVALKYKEITMYFHKYLKETLTSANVSNREKRLCLQGLSSFSGVYYLHLQNEEIRDLFCLLVQNFEQSFVLNPEPPAESLEYLPFYIQTVTKFVTFRKISNSEFFCLQKSSVTMIKAFPQLPYSCHAAVIEALVTTFYFLLDNDEKLCDNFIEGVVYQGVVWTCSHRHALESALEEDSKVVTVKNYFNLWKGLLGILPLRKFDKHRIFLHERKFILVKITDKLIRTMLILINKLNVSFTLNNTVDVSTDIEVAYKVAETNDFAIFLNLVDFYQEIFQVFDPSILKKCVCKLIQHLIAKCLQYNVVSGFYKLLACCLKTANKIENFFDSGCPSQDVEVCLSTLTKFLETLLHQIQQFKGDLLVACLHVLLAYPSVVIQKILLSCVPAFKIIFQVGRTYTNIAFMALNTLEYWQKTIHWDEMDPFLVQIVPLLDCYLQSKSLGDLTGNAAVETRRKTAQALKKRKVLVDSEPELTKLQMRILTFLGQQRDSVCQAFAFCDDNIGLSVIGNQQHLKITLPYGDIKLDVYIDKLLPRIVYVALNSTDRRSRVMACEVLQAAIMIFLGKTKQMPHSSLSDLNQLLAHISTPLLKLGCDMDQVVEQLFRPLCFQLIHWYTHASQLRGEHSAIIMEAVLDGITHPNDTALRDFCGKCVNEYMKWTIKQTNEKNLAKDPINVKVLLKKMRFYSTHPDIFKKLGAALIFNNIYKEIREEMSLLSMFWVEFLHVFVTSLSTYEDESKNDVTVAQINIALAHIERGFVHKADLFNRDDRERRVPLDLRGGTLKDVAVWLLEQTGSKSTHCRSKCIEMFSNIVPRTLGFTTLRDFVQKNCEDDNWVERTYDGFLVQYPTMGHLKDYSEVGPIKWMQRFLCALDGYFFIISQKLGNELSESLKLAVGHFIGTVSTISLNGAFVLIEAKEWVLTDFEKKTFDSQRSQAVVKIFRLFDLLEVEDSSRFCNRSLWSLITNIFFEQQLLGFDIEDPHVGLFLRDFMNKLPDDMLAEFMGVLEGYLAKHFVINIDLESGISFKLRSIIRGLNMLQSFNLQHFIPSKYNNGMVKLILDKFFVSLDGDMIYMNNLQDTTVKFCVLILDFALADNNEFLTFIDYLYKPFKVQSAENKQPVHFGTYILNLFEDSVIPKVVKNFELFLNLSVEKYLFVEFVTLITAYASSRKEFRHESNAIVGTILAQWGTLEKFFTDSTESGLTFVKNLLPLRKHGTDVSPLRKWLMGLLQVERDLSSKTELDVVVEVFYLLVDVLVDDDADLRQTLGQVKTRLLSVRDSIPTETREVFLEKLMSVIPKIKACELLIFLLGLYGKDFAKITALDLNILVKSYILTGQDTQRSLVALYNLYLSSEFSSEEKYRLMTETTASFQYCSLATFEGFFVLKIKEVITTLKSPLSSDNIVEKLLSFSLVEVLFSRCSIRSGDTEISRVASAAGAKSNKELVVTVLKYILNAIKDSLEDALLRLYKCHSYNAMISIVSNSLRDDNFYTKLFIRQDNNVDVLWNNLVDTQKKYLFQTDFDSIPKRRKILVNIRNEMSSTQGQSVRYVESVRVYNSSLSEDLSKFDFTNNIVRSQTDGEQVDRRNVASEVELDGTDINTHECMANVCGLIDHMINTGITELPTEDDSDYELPTWLSGIRSLLLNSETHVNVKIFWVKVIDNTIHVFKHFAKWFLEPVLKFLVDGCAGEDINYFLTDVVGILATWSANATPKTDSEKSLSSELIKFLIDNLNNERQDMFKYHLELIRVLVEAWRGCINVPYDSIQSKLDVDPTSKKVEVGIHLSSIFLANRIFPWKDSVTDFCKKLFNVVTKVQHKSIYRPCAETIGLLLSALGRDGTLTKIVGNVHVLLKKISDNDKYAHVLEGIVLHYPEIGDEHQLRILLSRLYGVPKQLKTIYLKIILSRSNLAQTLSDFKTEKWDSYIDNDNLEVQLLTLELVHRCLDTLEQSPLFNSIVESVCKHVANASVLCRSRVFDIVISLCKKQSDIATSYRKVLIQGLIDSDADIRDKVYNFWRTNSHLSTQISERFVYILTNMYENNTENDFLGYSCFLLLDSIKNNEEYKSILFEHPLEDCDFEDYHLQTNWRSRHLSMAPLFIETVRSASEDFDLSNTDMNKLRETQTSREFTPTQTIRNRQFSQITMSQSSLYIGSQNEPEFVNPNLVSISHKYRIPKRRFLHDKSKILSHFAQQEVKKSIEKVEKRKDLAKERENKVVIYRSYRRGDLPDIQITLQAIMDPLQALTLHDREISKIFFSEIFQCMWLKTRSDENFISQLARGIKTIFSTSIQFNRNLFRTLFDVLFLCKNSLTVPTELVVTVSQSSGLRALGVLLLEEYLISYDDKPSDSKRMRGLQSHNEYTLWIKLAELYKEMNEWDVVKSLFLQKTECPEHVKNAILAESHNQWKDAQDLYKIAIESDENEEAKDFYYESYFKCFAYLGEWSNLVKSIDSTLSHSDDSCWKDLWDQGFGQNKLMPWYIGGQLKNILFTQAPSDRFFEELNGSLNSEHLDYLENNFSEEIAMLWIIQKEVNDAQKYVKMYLNNFLNVWQQLDFLYTNARYHRLLKLRNVIDIHKFVNIVSDFNLQTKTRIRDLINHWQATALEKLPSILFSEERLLYRRQFVNTLIDKVKNDEELEQLLVPLNAVRLNLIEGFLETALDQSNFYMGKKYMTDCRKRNPGKYSLVFSRLVHIKSLAISEVEKKIGMLIQGCKSLDQIFSKSEPTFLKVSASITLFDHLEEISNLFCDDNALFQNNKQSVAAVMGTEDISSSDQIASFAVDKLKLSLQTYETEAENDVDESESARRTAEFVTIANAYVKLAHFVKKKGQDSDFIVFVLRAMKFNSSEGRQLFPCIIMAEQFSKTDQENFLRETPNIPVWMFLAWIPQILVSIDSPKVTSLAPLVLRIAKMYPQAIMYPYRLSRENYKLEHAETKILVDRLDELLNSNENVNKFLKTLSFIAVPAAILSYHVRKMMKIAHLNKTSELQTTYKYVLDEVFSYKSASDDHPLQGNTFKKINKYEKELKTIERYINKKGGNTQIVELLRKIDSELGVMLRDKKDSKLLKDYSPWLANFSAHKLNFDLEIPGQYDGDRMPLPQRHVKIAGFCPNVSIMSSLRKPIKITIVGNDTKQYPFLVKFGEDVRQDQRIQQLFTLMNKVFEGDINLRGQKFSILTYQVIPLTNSLGMIQWVDNTKSLQESMKGSKLSSFDQISETYRKWIFRNKNQSVMEAYGSAAMTHSRDKTIVKFRSLVSSLEWDVLKSFFLKLGANVETFFILRNNFIVSYAVMCVSQWILGVGDRHLLNTLICLHTGKVLGIDFGHAFGTATQILPVPELVPFRLTPHLINLMEPLGEKCLFREVMIHCLRSLKSNSGSLLSTMKVFIEEPSLDWLDHASRFSGSVQPSDAAWYPAQKINQAERKLLGVNPKNIVIEDLEAGHQRNESYMKAYVKLVRGDLEHDVRATKDDEGLSVEDQVDCLIDQATDYNLLGRMYEGWTPWV